VLANGGGTTAIAETPSATSVDRRVIGTAAVTGLDLNGDGDKLDTVRFYTPNTTNTYRLGINASLIWDFSDTQRFRLAYTLDRARHRQTGEYGLMGADGTPQNVFAGNKGSKIATADGSFLRGRDRYSIAELNQVSAEWHGKFMDNKLTATVGLRAPHFKRELNQYCYSQNQTSNVLCTTQTPVTTLPNGNVRFVAGAATTAANPEYIPAYSATVKFNELLPNVGFTYEPWDNHSFYISYAEGLSAPRTDNLYAVTRLTGSTDILRALPDPEKTKTYDLGWRYNTPTMLASFAIWHSDYTNRIVSAFDSNLGFNVDRNVGDVKIDGVDGQVGLRISDAITVSGSASYNSSKLQSDIVGGQTGLKGKTLVETPKWTFAGRGDFHPLQPLHLGIQVKFVGDRYGTDNNNEIAPRYTVWDLDARYSFDVKRISALDLQLNVTNLLDANYFGNISSGTGATATAVAFYSIGSPRTVQMSLEAKF
jgi:iron complex outermembrane receptor protein